MTRLWISLLALTLLLGGCKRRETPVDAGNRSQRLLLGNAEEPNDLDPQLITAETDAHIVQALFEGLLALDPKTLAAVPAAAERWEVSKDGLVYTFHLRPGARWSDGSPVTASDFLFSYRRILSPALGSEYAYMHFVVRNAEAYHAGKIADFQEVGYKALDPLTLQVTLAAPTPYLPALVAHQSWYPVPQAVVERFGRADERGTRWTLPGNLVGNGPFTLKTWRVNEVVETVKNPLYWDAAHVRLNAICFYPIEESDTEERAFRAGILHVTTRVPVAKLAFYREKRPRFFHAWPEMATMFLKCNTLSEPLNRPGVRRALALALDRERFVKSVLRGDQIPAYRLTPPGLGGYEPGKEASFEPDPTGDRARKELADAGYPGGKGFPPVELLIGTGERNRLIGEGFQQMWKQTLGIEVKLLNQEGRVFQESMRTGHYQLGMYGWIGDYPDPNTFLDLFVSGGGNNQTGWADPEYDRLIGEAARTFDTQARFALFRRAEGRLMTEMPIIPLFYAVHRALWKPEVVGWTPNLLNVQKYKDLFLDPSLPQTQPGENP